MSATTDEYLLLWKGQQTGPFKLEQINEKLRLGEISRIHQIGLQSGWQLLDEFLEATRDADLERQRVEEQKRREDDLKEQRRREEDLKRKYETQLAEERAKRGPKTQPLQQSSPHSAARDPEVQSPRAPASSAPLPAPPTFTPSTSAPAAAPVGGVLTRGPGAPLPPPAFAAYPAPPNTGFPGTFAAPPPPFVDAPTRTSGLAVAALVMGLCNFIPFVNLISWILALIFGHVALSRMSTDHSLKGRGMALAGLIITYVLIALGALIAIAAFATGKPIYDFN